MVSDHKNYDIDKNLLNRYTYKCSDYEKNWDDIFGF